MMWTMWTVLLLPVLAPLAAADDIYTKSSPVLQIDAKNYDRLIAKSNYTSIVEFYAPWCGHCKNLKPAYEKAATQLTGLGNVAAMNCDEDANKPFCGRMGIKGFPTLKLVRPAKKAGGRPKVDDYNGERSAKAMRDAVVDKLPHLVARVKDESFRAWLDDGAADRPKAVFFGQKGLVPAFVKALAVDFKDVVDCGYARDADTAVLKHFGVKASPAVVVLPSGGAEPVIYDGEVQKAPLLEFLSKYATPNPDALPKETKKAAKKSKESKDSKAKKSKKAKEDL